MLFGLYPEQIGWALESSIEAENRGPHRPDTCCWQVLGASAAEVQEEMRGLADMYAHLDLDALYSDPLCAVCGPAPAPAARQFGEQATAARQFGEQATAARQFGEQATAAPQFGVAYPPIPVDPIPPFLLTPPFFYSALEVLGPPATTCNHCCDLVIALDGFC